MTADSVGGVWTYALELTKALAKFGVEVNLATMGPPLTAVQRNAAQEIPNLNIFKSDFKLEWMQDAWRDVRRAGEWLLNLENRLRPDIVHLNGFSHAALSWASPVLVAGHSCVFSWWRAVKGSSPTPEWEHYREKVKIGLREAHVVVAPTRAMLEALIEHYGPLSNTRVILNGRETNLFSNGKKRNLILSAGRLWDEAKNIKALIEIAPMLNWPIYLAGETQHPDGTAVEEALPDNCYLLGQLSGDVLRLWFSHASIYALPARYEPFGLTALEAGLSGCALVLGNISSLREVWGEAAVFVDPEDRGALQSQISRLIEDRQYRSAFAARAEARAREFSSQRMANDYIRTYGDLLKLRSRRYRFAAKMKEIELARSNVLPVARF